MHKVAALFAIAVAIAACEAWAQPVTRTEVYPVPAQTLTTTQILNGEKGTPVMLAGELRIPRPGTDRLPAVILVHGSGGIGPNIDAWAKEINALGAAAFILDSFSGRGIVSTSADQSQLDHLAMMTDAYQALALLAQLPRIDPKRIAIMGFSKGAVAALYSSNARFRKLYAPANVAFVAHVGLYTPCNMQFHDDEKLTGAPIRLFHGTPDDWVPVAPCREYVARLKKDGADISLTEYPGAYHAYDSPAYPSPAIFRPEAQTSRNCRMRESDKGQMLSASSGAVFTYADPCIEHGAHFGYNQAAHEATLVAVRAFLKSVFKL